MLAELLGQQERFTTTVAQNRHRLKARDGFVRAMVAQDATPREQGVSNAPAIAVL